MLTQIDLHHFKCFEVLRLPISHLTILSGSNAAGKSSLLQALVLLHQTMRDHEWSTRLLLNGSSIHLGTVSDVVDKVHGRRSFEIGLSDSNHDIHWTFSGERSQMSMSVDRIVADGITYSNPATLRHLLPPDLKTTSADLTGRLRRLTYITAERVGPREVYSLEDKQLAPVVGPMGEHAVSVLHWGRDEHVVDELVLPSAPPTRLRQVEERMKSFFPGCTLMLQQVPQANAVTLGLRTSDDTDFHRPIHAGFGLTQVLPILISALSATPGDILLIENPEVHLHPAGQALLGQFLAEVAHAKVQILVETHSDHILNGIRRSVKSKRVKATEVRIHFFTTKATAQTQVTSPTIDSSGNIDSWPDGFFDQFDKDINYFAEWGE